MKICEKVLMFWIIVSIVLLGAAVVKMEKQARALDEAALWVDAVDIRINSLQERSDDVQRECIDVLNAVPEPTVENVIDMQDFECHVLSEGDLLTPRGVVTMVDLECYGYLE